MQVLAFSSFEELLPHAEVWDRLAVGVPFRGWAWLSCWWKHYGDDGDRTVRRQLMVLGVFEDSGDLVGIAPWFCEWSPAQGRVLRWLGSGEICSDYLSVLCRPDDDRVAEALADFLTAEEPSNQAAPAWDLLEIRGVDGEDRPVSRLVELLAARGCEAHELGDASCWRLEIPATWNEYLAMLSKGHRKQMRRLTRDFLATGRAVLYTIESREELEQGIEMLETLHRERRRTFGQAGCFASQPYADFHREVMPLLLDAGSLELHCLEIDGRPAAAEYHITSGGIAYAYQSGIGSRAIDAEPGRLITMAIVRRAIERGIRAIDFLRGDEPYKAHFRARSRTGIALRIVPNRAGSRLRNRLWMAGRSVKRMWTGPNRAAAPQSPLSLGTPETNLTIPMSPLTDH